jgi:hypothetical protein
MNEAKIEQMYMNIEDKAKKFRPMSDYIVKTQVTDPAGGDKLTQEHRDVISMFSSIDMAMGSESTKNQYLLVGGLIGIVSTIVIVKIRNKFKKRKA